MKTQDFYYNLPESLIAQVPLEDRTSSKLLVLDKKTGKIEHRHFKDILEYLEQGDTLVLNNTRVIPARIFGTKEGFTGKIEVLMLKDLGEDTWECLVPMYLPVLNILIYL